MLTVMFIAPAQHVVEYERVVFHDGFNPNE